MLVLGDALALAASRRRCFTNDDFAKRHPGGALGGLLRPITEALRFTVGKNLSAVPDNLSGSEALARAETGVRRPGALLLVDAKSGILTGIFTDADLRRLILKNPAQIERPIKELMTRSPATLPHTALVRDWVQMVRETRRDEVPVVDESGRPVGLLDVQDLIAMRLVQAD
jgi:arabinose-5-phosphate isomerase